MKLRALGAIGLSLALVVGGCNDAKDAEQRPVVVVIGDSNVYYAYDDLKAELAKVDVASIVHGVLGYGLKDLAYWQKRVTEYDRLDPAVVVVALGTNDAKLQATVDAVPGEVDKLMRTIGQRPVVWLTHVDDRPGSPSGTGRAVNEAIRAATARWPNLTILDFTEEIEDDPTLLDPQGLHFSARGKRYYAQKIAEAAAAAEL